MKLSLDNIISEIRSERLRQQALPGSEYDLTYNVNDWISIVIHYLTQDVNRKGIVPGQNDFHNNLVKAAAIIIAALQHEDSLVNKNKELVNDNGIDKERQKL